MASYDGASDGSDEDLLKGIDLAVLEPIEAYALRAILEYEGLRVNWSPISTWDHLQHLLQGQTRPLSTS